jgi:hypothetical protein
MWTERAELRNLPSTSCDAVAGQSAVCTYEICGYVFVLMQVEGGVVMMAQQQNSRNDREERCVRPVCLCERRGNTGALRAFMSQRARVERFCSGCAELVTASSVQAQVIYHDSCVELCTIGDVVAVRLVLGGGKP